MSVTYRGGSTAEPMTLLSGWLIKSPPLPSIHAKSMKKWRCRWFELEVALSHQECAGKCYVQAVADFPEQADFLPFSKGDLIEILNPPDVADFSVPAGKGSSVECMAKMWHNPRLQGLVNFSSEHFKKYEGTTQSIRKMFYFTDDTLKELKGEIDLTACSNVVVDKLTHAKYPNVFGCQVSEQYDFKTNKQKDPRCYYLASISDVNKLAWTEHISLLIPSLREKVIKESAFAPAGTPSAGGGAAPAASAPAPAAARPAREPAPAPADDEFGGFGDDEPAAPSGTGGYAVQYSDDDDADSDGGSGDEFEGFPE